MISVAAENEAVWFSVVTLSCVLAFVPAPVLPAQAGVRLAGVPCCRAGDGRVHLPANAGTHRDGCWKHGVA